MVKIDKLKVLKEYFGHSEFRTGQEKVIDEILSGRDVFGIMPTGAGKSICYQLPALMMEGITLVISPLISLMKDQVNSLVQNGVRAAYLNSSLTYNQYLEAIRRASRGEYKIIYVAPERLWTSTFMDFASSVDISMITVDEAHCVSQWGHDFRPNYLKIVQFVEKLKKRPVICAMTATATKEVKKDIINILKLKNPYEIVTGFDRENLYFGVMHTSEKFKRLLSVLSVNEEKSTIIYCATRKTVEEVCEKLIDKGYSATRYHAGLEEWERKKNQEDFQNDIKKIMVATNAFGMGIDKSNVSLIVHYNMPKSIESYYQEAGRAGRDNSKARCIMFYSPYDIVINKMLIDNQTPNPELTEKENQDIKIMDLKRLDNMVKFSQTTKCLRGYLLNYFGENSMHQCNNCSSCLSVFNSFDITLFFRKIVISLKELESIGKLYGKTIFCDILRGNKNKKITDTRIYLLECFGIMSEISKKDVYNYIEALEELDFIETDFNFFGVLKVTQKGYKAFIDNEKVMVKLRQEPEREKLKKRKIKKKITENESTNLYDELKTLRTHIASKAFVPPYVVFSDMTLKEMCKKLPTTDDEFLEVPGVGNYKLEKYGREFMDIIKKYK